MKLIITMNCSPADKKTYFSINDKKGEEKGKKDASKPMAKVW
jgi:hypothetical protein